MFIIKILKKVTQHALKNQDVAREYKSFQRRLEDGVDPIEIGYRASDLGDGITYVRTKNSRFVVQTIDAKTEDIIGIAYRGNRQDMKVLATVMKEQYGVNF